MTAPPYETVFAEVVDVKVSDETTTAVIQITIDDHDPLDEVIMALVRVAIGLSLDPKGYQ